MIKTDKKLFKNENGIGHIFLILIFVLVLGVIGVAGARVYQNNKPKTSDESTQKTNDRKYDDQRVDSKVLSNLKGTEENEQ